MDLLESFQERLDEIEDYFAFLNTVDTQIQERSPERPTTEQQRILFSTVYLQLYNLIEATMSECLAEVVKKIIEDQVSPLQLNDGIQKKWLKSRLKPHKYAPEKVLNTAHQILNDLNSNDHYEEFQLAELLKTGNWNTKKIEDAGLSIDNTYLNLEATGIMRHFKNQKRPLEYIQEIRNHLSHGSKTFGECGREVTISDLKGLKTKIKNFLQIVIISYITYIDNQSYKSQSITSEAT